MRPVSIHCLLAGLVKKGVSEMWESVIRKLKAGEPVTISPKGDSMTPRIKSGQQVTIYPVYANYGSRPVRVGDVVLAKVKGRYYLHLVSAMDGSKVQISNNHKHINGWTNLEKVYGIADV